MTRREIKKQLSLARYYLKNLPRLIDCSVVGGDSTYTSADLERAQGEVKKLEGMVMKAKHAV